MTFHQVLQQPSLSILVQTWPIIGQTAHEALTADPLVLGLLVVVLIALTFLVTKYFQGRHVGRDDDRWDMFFKAFTDEKSPMVQSNNRIASAVELGNELSKKQTASNEALIEKTGDQTLELSKQTTVFETSIAEQKIFSGLIIKDLSMTTETMTTMKGSFDNFKTEVKSSIDDISRKIDLMLQDKDECLKLRERLDAFESEFNSKVAEQVKRATTEVHAAPEKSLGVKPELN